MQDDEGGMEDVQLIDRLYDERIRTDVRLECLRDTLRKGISSGHHVGFNSGFSQK